MNLKSQCTSKFFALIFAAFSLLNIAPAFAENKHALLMDAEAALQSLYEHNAGAKALGEQSAGILVFPNIVRAGFIVGGSGGDGVLFKKGKAVAFYNSGSASIGFQAGVQTFGYAVFLIKESTVRKFQNSKGWDIGAAPTLVVVDSGFGKEVNTAALQSDLYAFIFDQKGLMAGVGLQGQKITKIK